MRITSRAITATLVAAALATLTAPTVGLGIVASLLSGGGIGTIGN
jgi:hypothetical protein